MKTIHLSQLQPLLRLDLDSEMNVNEQYLDVCLISNWGAENEADYIRFEGLIDDYKDSGEGWKLRAWCDISGYNYWMIQQEEPNYIQLCIEFDYNTIKESELNNIQYAILKAETFFTENIQSFY